MGINETINFYLHFNIITGRVGFTRERELVRDSTNTRLIGMIYYIGITPWLVSLAQKMKLSL